MLRLDGKIIEVEARTARLFFKGQPAVLTTLRDISEQRRVEKEILQLYGELETRVENRTIELSAANAVLERQAGQLRGMAEELARAEQHERQRLARILHDNLQQLLVGAKFSVEMLEKEISPAKRTVLVRRACAALVEALQVTRSLTAELYPSVLHSTGLAAALEWLRRDVAQRYNLQLELTVDSAAEPVSEEVRIFLFDAVRELMLNVIKHAGVSSVKVELIRTSAETIQLVVEDRGKGFKAVPGPSAEAYEGLGLYRIQQRIEAFGGYMDIRSAPGEGTRITIIANSPVRQPQQAA